MLQCAIWSFPSFECDICTMYIVCLRLPSLYFVYIDDCRIRTNWHRRHDQQQRHTVYVFNKNPREFTSIQYNFFFFVLYAFIVCLIFCALKIKQMRVSMCVANRCRLETIFHFIAKFLIELKSICRHEEAYIECEKCQTYRYIWEENLHIRADKRQHDGTVVVFIRFPMAWVRMPENHNIHGRGMRAWNLILLNLMWLHKVYDFSINPNSISCPNKC